MIKGDVGLIRSLENQVRDMDSPVPMTKEEKKKLRQNLKEVIELYRRTECFPKNAKGYLRHSLFDLCNAAISLKECSNRGDLEARDSTIVCSGVKKALHSVLASVSFLTVLLQESEDLFKEEREKEECYVD